MPTIFRTLMLTTLLTVATLPAAVSPVVLSRDGEPAAVGGAWISPAVGAAGIPVPVSEFGWPLQPVPTVSRPFQPPSKPYGPGHRGADLVGTQGQPVLSAGPGVVVYAGPLADRGVVSVDHAGGLRTTYEPLAQGVRPGQVVARGEPLGTLAAGHPGCPSPACLHWGLRRDREYLDPLLLVRPAHVRLLPWAPEP